MLLINKDEKKAKRKKKKVEQMNFGVGIYWVVVDRRV